MNDRSHHFADAMDRPVDIHLTEAKPTSSVIEPLSVTLALALAHVERATKADKSACDHRTSAGLRFKELKDRVGAGEAGPNLSWASYCAEHIPQLSQRTVERYIAIADGKTINVSPDSTTAQPMSGVSPAEEEAMRRAHFDRARESARQQCAEHGIKGAERAEMAFLFWLAPHPDSAYDRAEWNAMCDQYAKGRGKVSLEPGTRPQRDDSDIASRKASAQCEDDSPTTGEEKKAKEEKVRAQAAARQARRRAKSSSIRKANGGNSSSQRRDKEHLELAKLWKALEAKMTAGQMQVALEAVEKALPELWPLD
jgi:hypothetical protein